MISVILPCCNQGNWVRHTVEQVRKSMGQAEHEIVIVDDQSVDKCCHGLPPDVLIVRPDQRLGVSGARRHAIHFTKGDILLFADPHCSFPDGALPQLAELARRNWAVVQPPTVRHLGSTNIAWGGRIVRNERGVALGNGRIGERHSALINTIYCLRRDVYDWLGGWPHLPGCWGYSEQAMSLLCWFSGVPAIVAHVDPCIHHMNHENRRLAFTVSTTERAINGHYVHKAFLPETYEDEWRPVLAAKYGRLPEIDRSFAEPLYHQLVKQICDRAVRTERQFYQEVMGQVMPDKKYLAQQRRRSQGMKLSGEGTNPARLYDSFLWFKGQVPGCLRGRNVLDLGCRDGKSLEILLKEFQVRHAEGVELLDEIAQIGRNRGLIIRTGDMRHLPDDDNVWHIVSCIHTLEHVPDPQEAIAEMARVLIPNGRLLIVVPRQATPRDDYAHNSCFPDSMALRKVIAAEPMLDPDSIRYKVVGKTRDKMEIRLTCKKKSP